MKVYVDFKYLDAEDLPSNISNKYALQVKSINSGAEYKYFDLVDIADYTKQVRKEVSEKLKTILNESCYMSRHNSIDKETLFKILDQIQGE